MTLSDAYALVGVESAQGLHKAYCIEDQILMKSGTWDYKNPFLLTNRVKEILLALDPNSLDEHEREWRQEILWYWHHHAISSALWIHKCRSEALSFATEALKYQDSDHPNKLTRLLYLLIQDKLAEAETWADEIVDEKIEAAELLQEYKAGKFF